ncbi:formylglycine-generating enzyme family protein [uncultured Thiodictyon sp.]|uniref:formylglycine-generating enzyme family protein n=1 Tax=uncultured Thiodictyon sp. TaxID=1846217 RepID=UPI0025F57237|nr:formylglycine-generating enzyme family protein [uncultured Thiodictyon sp.]
MTVRQISDTEPPNIHGWPAHQVQALQQAAAAALGRPPVFRDPEFSVSGVEKVQTGQRRRKRWLRPDQIEPIYEGREVTLTVVPPELTIIPAGRFIMGSPEDEVERAGDEGPQHEVTLSRPFAIGRYAVTFDDYDAFCCATGRDPTGDAGWGRGRRPVIQVTWDDALAYCQWLSQHTGRSYRLPTEVQWEYACRAGTVTPFHCGETLCPDQANYNGNYPCGAGAKGPYREQTVPVGSLPANPWGLYEMHGNVQEWCQDWYGDYAAGPLTDPGGPAAGKERVLRGGSWFDEGRHQRSALRNHDVPGYRNRNVGFRVALEFEL